MYDANGANIHWVQKHLDLTDILCSQEGLQQLVRVLDFLHLNAVLMQAAGPAIAEEQFDDLTHRRWFRKKVLLFQTLPRMPWRLLRSNSRLDTPPLLVAVDVEPPSLDQIDEVFEGEQIFFLGNLGALTSGVLGAFGCAWKLRDKVTERLEEAFDMRLLLRMPRNGELELGLNGLDEMVYGGPLVLGPLVGDDRQRCAERLAACLDAVPHEECFVMGRHRLAECHHCRHTVWRRDTNDHPENDSGRAVDGHRDPRARVSPIVVDDDEYIDARTVDLQPIEWGFDVVEPTSLDQPLSRGLGP